MTAFASSKVKVLYANYERPNDQDLELLGIQIGN